jgi:hypothetical protein
VSHSKNYPKTPKEDPKTPIFYLFYAQDCLGARVLTPEMRGRGVSFIGGVSMPHVASCRAALGDAALGMLPATWRSYPPRGPSTESSPFFARVLFFDPIYGAAFGGLLVLKMGHAANLRKARDVYFPKI